ncbi:MAG: cyclic nucleotide-binding domain-containing protein [Actinomycetes bacterium]|jgi:CRP-like cAMP-binding protein
MAKRTNQYVESIAEVPLFSACSRSDLNRIARLSEEVVVPAGRRVVEEGALGDQFFVIMDGTAKVTRRGRRVATLGRGDAFGELSLLVRSPRNATVTAETDLDVLVLGQREFSGLVDTAPGFARKLLAALAERLREADARTIQ